MLLPHLADVVVERVERCAAGLRLWAQGRARRAACPRCGSPTGRVHSRYERRLEDVALAGEPVELRIRPETMAYGIADEEIGGPAGALESGTPA